MQRFISILLTLSMILTLVSCGKQTADKYCTHCGNGMAKNDSFCAACGGAVGEVDSSSTTTESTTTTTTTTAKTTTTAHQHTYSKYVCTGCGEVDKAHAYEYLLEWTKENGETDGIITTWHYVQGDFDLSFFYETQYDRLLFCVGVYQDDIQLFTSLALDTHSYTIVYEGTEKYELIGFIPANEFTSKSPISYTKYNGNESAKDDFIEYSRDTINRVIESLDFVLKNENIGITLSDLGFWAYQIP